jgi:uncharacterized protein YprB with RNaseH-like and TPR domain
MREVRTAIWDIEAGGLDANYDVMLCATIKQLEGPMEVFQIGDKRWNDKKLLREVSDYLTNFDVLVHHYGDRYDVPFTNTRLLIQGLPLLDLSNTILVDTWWTARHAYKFNNNRLATLIDALGTPTSKSPLDGPIWIKAKAGGKRALDYIVEHNIRDVEALEEVVKIMAAAGGLKYRYWK